MLIRKLAISMDGHRGRFVSDGRIYVDDEFLEAEFVGHMHLAML
jgi:hypothetical protein